MKLPHGMHATVCESVRIGESSGISDRHSHCECSTYALPSTGGQSKREWRKERITCDAQIVVCAQPIHFVSLAMPSAIRPRDVICWR